GAHGDPTGFGTAHAVEDAWRVAGGEDRLERRQRGADDLHPADELVGAPIGVHAIDHQRLHLERLRTTTVGRRVAAVDVLEAQPVGFALTLDLVDQLLAEVSPRERAPRTDDEIALARDHLVPRLAPSVSVALQEGQHRRASEEEALELALLDEHHLARAHG